VVIAAGLIFLRSRALAWFAIWTLVMWVYWYIIGNMTYRWGLPAMMLLLTMTLLVFMELIDRAADRKRGGGGNRWQSPFQHITAKPLHAISGGSRVRVLSWRSTLLRSPFTV